MATKAIWERMPNETAEQYLKFCAYRDMKYEIADSKGRTHDIPKVDLTKDRSLNALAKQIGRSVKTLEPLCKNKNWVERVEAYDIYIEQKKRKQHEADILKMNERHSALAIKMIKKATNRINSIPDDELSARDIARFIDVGVKIERLSRGESTDNQRISGEITANHNEQIDLSNLTEDELRKLAAMGGGDNGDDI